MDAIILTAIFLMVSFWAYCNLFYQQKTLPYAHGYLIFTIFQWVLICTNLVRIFGWTVGLVAFVVIFAFGAILVTNFTTNQIYGRLIFKGNPLPALACFAASVPITAVLTIITFFVPRG